MSNDRVRERLTPPAFRVLAAEVRFGHAVALTNIHLTVERGERIALIGPSGAGKSTLIRLLNASHRPTSGRVEIFGVASAQQRPKELRILQSRIGTIYQQFDLIGPLRVVHNVNAGHLGRWSLPRAAASLVFPRGLSLARQVLRRVGIADKLFERTDTLSGGQLQRVALARVLVQDPDVILADEPISNLDPMRSREIMDLLRDLALEDRRTLLVSVHDYSFAFTHFSRVIALRDGTVFFDKTPEEIADSEIEKLYETERR